MSEIENADALNAAARAIQAALMNTSLIQSLTRQEGAEQIDAIRASADNVALQTQIALQHLKALGAYIPEISGDPRPTGPERLPLHLLDTPHARLLLGALEVTADIAAEVDRERGCVDANGEPIGIGRTLAEMVAGLQREIQVPKGREQSLG